ncbi:MAG: EAL domain-containing protein [Ilumatobacteraceae bacterium]
MNNAADTDPWLASACEEIAVDVFRELVGNAQADGASPIATPELTEAARELIRERIGDVLGQREGPEMVFQPIVMLETRQVIGVEALSRFPGGPSTARWFRAADDVGMSSELQLSALMNALQHTDELPSGLLCVNVSAQLLDDTRLIDVLSHVDANRIVVEIVQPYAVTEAKSLLDGITLIRSLGLRIAFDDVGTGFLGLEHVLHVAPEIIKLSSSLTSGIGPDSGDLEPARELVGAARRSGTFVIAKGVESQGDVDTLNELGVEAAQGYFLGEPQPAEAFATD